MQHRLVVKTRSVESYSDSTPSSARQTTTSSRLGLRSSSTCNKGRNRWLRDNNLILLSVIFHYLLFQTVTLETNSKQNLGESESRTQLQLWSPLICQKTEFLLNCSILWQCSLAPSSPLSQLQPWSVEWGGAYRLDSDQRWDVTRSLFPTLEKHYLVTLFVLSWNIQNSLSIMSISLADVIWTKLGAQLK